MTIASRETASGTADSIYDRLEYGKFCTGADGPIEVGADHETLGYSPGFPPELVKLCTPAGLSLGISSYDMDSESLLDRGHKVGAVIRPFRHNGRFGRLAYRLGIRSEGGNKETRYYTAARYLFDPMALGRPYDIYSALGSLQGVTRGQQVNSLQPAADFIEEVKVAEHPDFLERALVAVMSGLPVEIESESEREFFALVDWLWTGLPPEAQPLIGAGWNVSSALGDWLSLSVTRRSKSRNACYSADAREWIRSNDTLGSPGRHYFERRLEVKSFDPREVLGHIDSKRLQEVKSGVSLEKLSSLPGLGDPATQAYFRSFGTSKLNDQVFVMLGDWLTGADVPWGDKFPVAVGLIHSSTTLSAKIVDLICSAVELETFIERIDSLVMECLRKDCDFFDCRLILPARIRFLVAVIKSDSVGALRGYSELAAKNRTYNLPFEALNKFASSLSQTLESDCISFHDTLLRTGDKVYERWIVKESEVAATQWAAIVSDRIPKMLETVVRLTPNGPVKEKVSVLASLSRGDIPQQNTNDVLNALSQEERIRIARSIEERWRLSRQSSATEHTVTDNISQWAQYFSLEVFSDPILRMIAGQDIDSETQFIELMQRMDFDHSSFIAKRFSRQLIRFVPFNPKFVQDNWKLLVSVLCLWSDGLLNLCCGYLDVPDIQRAPGTDCIVVVPSAAGICRLWSLWRLEQNSVKRNGAACTLCELCTNRIGHDAANPPLVVALQIAMLGKWLRFQPIDWRVAAEAEEIISLAKVKPVEVHPLWETARESWECLFILRLYPNEVLEPQPEHLAALLRVRKDLEEIASGIQLNSQTSTRLQPLSLGFYPQNSERDLPIWKTQYGSTCLWTLYCQLPASREIFHAGLDAHTDNEAQKAGYCRRMLQVHSSVPENYQKTMEIVACWFLGSLLDPVSKAHQCLLWDTLCAIGSAGWFERKQRHTDLVVNSTNDEGMSVTSQSIILADWMVALLFDLALRFGNFRELRQYVENRKP